MIISNINTNYAFGRLKITTNGDPDAKAARVRYACSCPFERWERIDKLSGKTPVEIKFYPSCDGEDHVTTLMSCTIGEETFYRPVILDGPKDFQKKLNNIEKKLHEIRNEETARKYFA